MKKILRSLLITALLLSVAQTGRAKDGDPPRSAKSKTAPAPQQSSAAPKPAAVPQPAPPQADVPQPVLVVSVSGYDKLISDFGFIGRLAQLPGVEKQVEAIITLNTQGQGLEGLDKKRPWGVVVTIAGGFDIQQLGFLPIKDLKKLLDALASLIGPVEEKGDGILLIEIANQRIYLKENNGWLFLARTPDSLAELPADPLKLLDGLDKLYEVAVKVHVHNIPEMFRATAVDYLKNFSQAAPPPDDEDEAAEEKRKELQEKQMKAMADFVNAIDQWTIGWALDQKTSTTYLDTTMTAMSGTPLADKLGALKETTSNYTGFMVPKSAAVFNSSQTLLVDDMDQAAQGVEQFRVAANREIENSPDLTDDDSRTAAKHVVDTACDAIKATIKTGKIDFGGSVLLGDRKLVAIAGAYVSETTELEKAVKDMVAVAAKDPNFPGLKFESATVGDVRFQTWTSPVPADDKVNRAIGKELKVAVGFGPKSLYFGVGTEDPLSLIKKAIETSKTGATTKVLPGMVDVSLQPILDFASVLLPDDDTLAAVQAELAKTAGKDHILIQTKPLPGGVSYRLELQEGVLKAIGLTAKMQLDKQARGAR